MSEETLTDLWSYDWRLRIGYDKTTRARVVLPVPGATRALREVLAERNRVQWAVSSYNPNQFIKVWEMTTVSGLVLFEGVIDGDTFTGNYIPLAEANEKNLVTQDGFQQVLSTPRVIRTRSEYWRETGSEQVDVHVQEINHLTNTMRTSDSVAHIGERSVNANNGRVETVLIADPDGEAAFGKLVPLSLNSGEVPYPRALDITRRRVAIISAQPRHGTVEVAGLDLGIRRGSERRLQLSDSDEEELFVVTGYTYEQQAGEKRIRQTLEGILYGGG
jgi:hypothetical protein